VSNNAYVPNERITTNARGRPASVRSLSDMNRVSFFFPYDYTPRTLISFAIYARNIFDILKERVSCSTYNIICFLPSFSDSSVFLIY